MPRVLTELIRVLGLLAVMVLALVLLGSLTGASWLSRFALHGALVLTAVAYSRMRGLPLLSEELSWRGRAFCHGLAGLVAGAGTTALVCSGLYLQGVPVALGVPPSAAPLLGSLWFATRTALCEEYFFRGFLLALLARRSSRLLAVLMSSACFAALHAVNPSYGWFELVYAFLLGVFLCLMVLRTGTLWFPIGFHLAFNVTQDLAQTSEAGGELLYLLACSLCILLALRGSGRPAGTRSAPVPGPLTAGGR